MRIEPFEHSTLMITARPAASAAAEWERIAHETTRIAATFPGHLGTTVLRPPPDTHGQYHIIVRFDSPAHLQGWRNSPERAEWVGKLQSLEEAPRVDVTLTGLESWFHPPCATAGDGTQTVIPPRWKMAVVIWIAVYFTVLPLLSILRPRLTGLPPWLASGIGAAASVVMMTWLVMPFLSWILQRWLYVTPNRSDGNNPSPQD